MWRKDGTGRSCRKSQDIKKRPGHLMDTRSVWNMRSVTDVGDLPVCDGETVRGETKDKGGVMDMHSCVSRKRASTNGPANAPGQNKYPFEYPPPTKHPFKYPFEYPPKTSTHSNTQKMVKKWSKNGPNMVQKCFSWKLMV